MGDFEAPIESAVETEATPQWEIPYEPPVEQNYNRQDDMAGFDGFETLEQYKDYILQRANENFEQKYQERRFTERIEASETRARENHDGSDGLPAYDELVNGYAAPAMRQQPQLHRLVLSQADPAAAAYLIGFCAAYPHLVPRVLEKNGRIDKSIFQLTNFRPTVKGTSGRQQASKINYENWDNESFIDELDRFKLSSEGE
jgi:hypothetical protein